MKLIEKIYCEEHVVPYDIKIEPKPNISDAEIQSDARVLFEILRYTIPYRTYHEIVKLINSGEGRLKE